MTTTTIKLGGDASPRDLSPLVRRLADVEIPAADVWPLVRGSHVAIAPDSDTRPIETAIHRGHLVATTTVGDATVYLSLGPDGAMSFTGSPVQIVAASFGLVEWSIEGVLTDERGTAPMSLTLGYHGVHRRAHRAWAWFTGSGRIDRPATPPADGECCQVVVDLLFEAPAHLADSDGAH